MRKNIPIWKTWNAHNANTLHKIQLPILLRGIEMLKIGGRIVYSTCSFSPGMFDCHFILLVENEAIVAQAMIQCNGSVKLVDCADRLPGLKRRAGITEWTVGSKSGEIYKTFADVPEASRGRIPETTFPPANIADLGMDKCMRIRPEDNNTGIATIC